MNPFVTRRPTWDAAELAAWNEGIQRARREYALHPFGLCPHQGNCARRWTK